jgi:hypothetical protein
LLGISAVDEGAKELRKRVFDRTSRRQTTLILMEIQRKSQNQECQVLNYTKEELEAGLSKSAPHFPKGCPLHRSTKTLRSD